MEVAVLGGGHGAFAAAADLAERGQSVRLWRRDRRALEPLLRKPVITLKDVTGTRPVELGLVSDDLGDVVAGADVILVPLPATAQPDLAAHLADRLEDGQIVFFTPGTFGSYLMASELASRGIHRKVTFVESGTLPYLARKHDATAVAISARATRLPAGALPGCDSLPALARLSELYPAIEPLRDALDAALTNAGPVIHPPLIVMNAGPIEHFPQWDIHNEGTQPSVRRVQDALDGERIAIREALGYSAPHYPLADHYNPDGEEWLYGNAGHERLVESSDWREPLDLRVHRYMREDVACGLAFLVSLAAWAQVPCPVAQGLLALGSAVTGEDLRATGRTMENLGLAAFSRDQLRDLLEQGVTP